MRLPERRHPPGPRPCTGAEVLRELLNGERVAPELLADEAASGEDARFTREEWFIAHAITFLAGCWNLVLVDYAHTRDKWWCWLPIAVWFSVLALHGGWMLLRRRVTARSMSEATDVARSCAPAVTPTGCRERIPFSILVAHDGARDCLFGNGMADGAVD
jgi:hypothetical protein